MREGPPKILKKKEQVIFGVAFKQTITKDCWGIKESRWAEVTLPQEEERFVGEKTAAP